MNTPLPRADARAALRPAERIELAVIAAAVTATWFAGADLDWTLQLRWAFGYSAALILGQGLIRDVVKLARAGGRAAEREKLTCLCGESTLGLGLLIVGAGGLSLLGVRQSVTLDATALTGLVSAILLTGFFAKDYVVTLHRVEDHSRIDVM